MSTITQRPTPETDAEVKRIQADQSIFVCEEFNVLSDFARKLERERDEAREELENILDTIPADAPCLHAETGETVADYILNLQKEVGKVHALYFNDKQQLEAMREAIKEAYDALTEANDRSKPEHSNGASLFHVYHKSKKARTKLQPFIKTKGIIP